MRLVVHSLEGDFPASVPSAALFVKVVLEQKAVGPFVVRNSLYSCVTPWRSSVAAGALGEVVLAERRIGSLVPVVVEAALD